MRSYVRWVAEDEEAKMKMRDEVFPGVGHEVCSKRNRTLKLMLYLQFNQTCGFQSILPYTVDTLLPMFFPVSGMHPGKHFGGWHTGPVAIFFLSLLLSEIALKLRKVHLG